MPSKRTNEAITSELIKLLREERERQKMPKMQLAGKAGLSRQMISFVESEDRMPTLDTLLRITSALGVRLEDLLATARKKAK